MQFFQRRVIRVFLGMEATVKELEISKLKIKGLKRELLTLRIAIWEQD